MKRLLMIVAAVVVLVVGAVAVGGVATSAQEGVGPLGTFLGRVAEKLSVSEDELQTAIDEVRTESIDEAVAEGRLTEEQAERARESGFPLRARFRGAGEHRGHVREAAAQVLGMSQEELNDELKDGNSLADVAVAQELGQEEFTTQLLAEIRAYYDGEVAEGELTQEQADTIFERIEAKIDDIVTREGGLGCPHHGSNGSSATEETSEITA